MLLRYVFEKDSLALTARLGLVNIYMINGLLKIAYKRLFRILIRNIDINLEGIAFISTLFWRINNASDLLDILEVIKQYLIQAL